MIVSGSVYLLSTLGGRSFTLSLSTSFGLIPEAVTGSFAIWQLASYIFLHGGFAHILFNMFALWMFGSDLERTWGTREFTRFFFICGIGAGISSVVADPSSAIPTIGASGSIYGILLAYGLLWPNRTILLIPFMIPIKVKYYVMFIGGLAFMFSVSGRGAGGIAHVAHLGGMIFAYLYIKWARHTMRFSIRNLRRYYDHWKREQLRRKFEVYYKRRQQQRRPADPNDEEWRRWRN